MTLKKIYGTLFLGTILSVSLLLAGCNKSYQSNGFDNDKHFDEIMQTDVIKAWYINYPPYFTIDPISWELGWIAYDMFNEAMSRLWWDIQRVEETTWASFIEWLEVGKYDIIPSFVWPTPARVKMADFSEPIFMWVALWYVREWDNRFDWNLSSINNPDVTIVTIEWEISSDIAKKLFPDANVLEMPNTTSISELLLNLSAKKWDVTFTEPLVAVDYMLANPWKIKAIDDVNAVWVNNNSRVVKKWEYKLLNTLNWIIEDIQNDGTVEQILKEYENSIWMKDIFYVVPQRYDHIAY